MVSWHAAKALAMGFPETEEYDHFGSPSFRVNGKIFAQLSAPGNEERRALLKLSSADQAALTMSDPDVFLAAPHWGRHGWTYIQLATVEELIFRDLLLRSWRTIAPRRLVASHLADRTQEKDRSRPPRASSKTLGPRRPDSS